MSKHIQVLVLLVLLFSVACSKEGGDQSQDGKMHHEEVSAFIFAPGIVSTELPEFATSTSENGDALFFNRTTVDRRYIQIYQSNRLEDGWNYPALISFSDTAFIDVDPFLNFDRKRLFFSSNRPLVGRSPKDFDLMYSEKIKNGWGIPVNLGAPINTEADEVFCSLTRSGHLYFSRKEEGQPRKIYWSEWKNEAFQTPKIVEIPVGDSISLGNPCIAPDESFLIFATADLPGEGGPDLFISYRQEDRSWGDPQNLGPRINSPYADFAPHISADGVALYYTSERPGMAGEVSVNERPPGDIYMIQVRGNIKR